MKALPVYSAVLALCLIPLAFLLPACSDEPEIIKIVVIASGSDFTGWYDIDGDLEYFAGDTVSGAVHSAAIELEDKDEVEVDVTTTGTAYSLMIRIYRNGTRVKSASTSSSDGDTLYLNITYKTGEESSEDTSEDSSS